MNKFQIINTYVVKLEFMTNYNYFINESKRLNIKSIELILNFIKSKIQMELKNFESKQAIIRSWNNTILSKAIIIFPKNITF